MLTIPRPRIPDTYRTLRLDRWGCSSGWRWPRTRCRVSSAAPVPVTIVSFAIGGMVYGPFIPLTYAQYQSATATHNLPAVLAARSAIAMVPTPLGTALGGPIVAALGGARTLAWSGPAVPSHGGRATYVNCRADGRRSCDRLENGPMEPLVYVDRSEVRPGKADELEAAARRLVEHVATHERRALSYGIYFAADRTTMAVVHVHPDSRSLEQLMSLIAPVLTPFRDLLQLRSIDVYGSVSDAVLAQLRKKAQLLGGTITLHDRMAGAVADALLPASASDT
jgi:hypothetical protein